MSEDAASRTEEPTPHKLEKAREKGDVVKTLDLGSFATLAAAASVVVFAGGWMSRNLAGALRPFFEHPHEMNVEGAGGVELLRYTVLAAAPIIGAVMLAVMVSGIFASFIQTGMMFTPEKLKPDFKKVSIQQGAKRIFGPDGLMQFAKSLVKVVVTSVIVWWILKPFWPKLASLSALEPAAMLPLAAEVLKRVVFAVAALTLAVAGFDWFWQRQRFMKRMRMTREELKEEYKQSDGDPHVKARQKQIRHERARRRMMQAVPEATMVVMNPTHYAVALKYEAGETAAPMCVAKGVDSLALKIREIAEEAGVPVIEDPPLARALYAAVEIDEMIPPAHYEAVAKIIGFIMNAANRRRAAARPL